MLLCGPRARVRRRAACWTIRRIARGRTVDRQVLAGVISDSRPRAINGATVGFEGVRVARASRVIPACRPV